MKLKEVEGSGADELVRRDLPAEEEDGTEAEGESYSVPCFVAFLIALN